MIVTLVITEDILKKQIRTKLKTTNSDVKQLIRNNDTMIGNVMVLMTTF